MNQSRLEKGFLKKLPNRPTEVNMRRSYNWNSKKIIFGAIGAVALLGSGAAYYFSNILSEGSNPIELNSTNFTNISTYTLSMTEEWNATGWNNNSFSGATLAYSAYAPSSTTVRNENMYNERDKDGNTPLIDAAYRGNIDVCTFLLNYPDIEVNKKSNDGYTAIHIAAFFCRLPIMKLLIKNEKVDLKIKDNKGRTALDIAREFKHSSCINLLQKAMKK